MSEHNPYRSTASLEAMAEPLLQPWALTWLHWLVTLGLPASVWLGLLLVVTMDTASFLFIGALSWFFGGVHTALVFRGCRKANVPAPDYLSSMIIGMIGSFFFLMVGLIAGGTSVGLFVNQAGPQARIPFPVWIMVISSVLGFGSFAGLFLSTIKSIVEDCKRRHARDEKP